MNRFTLGAVCSGGKTSFCVFAPYAHHVTLQIYSTDTSPRCALRKLMAYKGDGFFGCDLPGDLSGHYYTYCVDGVESVDPYARSCGVNSKRGFILADGTADPEGWDKDSFTAKPPIIWEVHVRDFSSDEWLSLPDAGKYTAFREGVSTPDGKPALIDYLKYLGVTYVQLMPVADFGGLDDLSGEHSWGYDPICYFSPEGSYSSDPHDGVARVKELKTLIKNLHSAGIGVILDMAFSHTYKKWENPLDLCAPDYYYRMIGKYPCNGSGYGNETRSESSLFKRLMRECMLYYMREYHVDGFRLDLMGLHDLETMNELRTAVDEAFPDGRGKNILIYGEPWYADPPMKVEGADKAHYEQLDERIGMYNDVTRNGIRGMHYINATAGYVQGNFDCFEEAMSGITGATDVRFMRVKSPAQQVLYAGSHDDYTLYDQIYQTTQEGQNRKLMCRMADFMIFSGLGVPLMLAGQEFYRTKGGDDNSDRSGDDVNKLDWALMSREWEGVNYYKGLIELRKSNHVFDDLSTALQHFTRLPAPEHVGAYIVGDVLYCVNATFQTVTVPVGKGVKIEQVCDVNRAGTQPFASYENEVTVKARNVFAGYIKR